MTYIYNVQTLKVRQDECCVLSSFSFNGFVLIISSHLFILISNMHSDKIIMFSQF